MNTTSEKMTPRSPRYLAQCAFVVWLLVLWAEPSAAQWTGVKWVDDGDTILLVDGRRVRYIGINAPEIAHVEYGREAEAHGEAALQLNRSLVGGRQVRLEFDRETKDHYGRYLAYVFLEDGTFVNLKMIEAGLAYVLRRRPNDSYDRELLAGQRRAMAAGRGIWRNWREHGGNIVGNRRSMRFHLATCPDAGRIHAKNRVALANRWEAYWQGYAPAKNCSP